MVSLTAVENLGAPPSMGSEEDGSIAELAPTYKQIQPPLIKLLDQPSGVVRWSVYNKNLKEVS